MAQTPAAQFAAPDVALQQQLAAQGGLSGKPLITTCLKLVGMGEHFVSAFTTTGSKTNTSNVVIPWLVRLQSPGGFAAKALAGTDGWTAPAWTALSGPCHQCRMTLLSECSKSCPAPAQVPCNIQPCSSSPGPLTSSSGSRGRMRVNLLGR